MSAAESPIRTAEIIAVGSELLGSTRLDTNSLYLSQKLESLGIELHVKEVVGDSRSDLATIFRHALNRADLVVLTGGLGPTDDDVTRDVVAEVLEGERDPSRLPAQTAILDNSVWILDEGAASKLKDRQDRS